MQVYCSDSATAFNIHQPLLNDNAPSLQLTHREDGPTTAKVDASFEVFERFANWLYNDVDIDVEEGGLDHYELDLLLKTHALGRMMGCNDFMDETLDVIMDWLPSSTNICHEFVIKAFARLFPPNSGGWNLAIDILLHTYRQECDAGCTEERGLADIDDQTFITDLVRRILVSNGFTVTNDINNPKYCYMTVFGFLEKQRREGEDENVIHPWLDDRCQYHRHHGTGLPCYRQKAGLE